MAGVVDFANLPGEALGEARYIDSYEQMLYQREVVQALYWKQDLSKLARYSRNPAILYRAEYADGSVTTNVPVGSGDPKEFFVSQSYYQAWQTRPDGEWENIAGASQRSSYYPQPVSRHGGFVYSGDSIQYRTNAVGYTYTVWEEKPQTYASSSYSEPLMPGQENQQELENEYGWSESNPCPTVTVWFSYDNASLDSYQLYWQQCRVYLLKQMLLLGGLLLGGLIAVIWLLVTCGRRPADRELHLLSLDRIWTEVTFGLTALAFIGAVSLGMVGVQHLIWQGMVEEPLLASLYPTGITVLSLLTMVGALSLMRLLKARRFLRNSLTFQVLAWCWRPFGKCLDLLRSCYDQRSFKNSAPAKAMAQRFVVFAVSLYGILGLLSLVNPGPMILAIMVAVCTLPLAYWHLRGLTKSIMTLLEQVDESHTQQQKSEGTKTALITNVSHDLKTPLTSIITYIDLLQKEELSDTARDYVTVLAQKSERLKAMVSDLFDLSKSSSGNLPLDPEVLDMKRLLEQTLADMDDHIQQSGLQLRTQLAAAPLYIYSDGKKLYRVFQNLIGNAIKYGMPGTRIFITLEQDGKLAVASIKNTAAYEMNFTPEEILQRFSRGDQSRTGEGSGLGLSIAESFTQACGGVFDLSIDGDFFKVTVSFPLTDKQPEAQEGTEAKPEASTQPE